MVRAYKAERPTKVPVISLTEDLYRHLSEHSHRKFYSQDIDPLKSFRRYDDEKVSFWYLDYLSICAESIGPRFSSAQRQAYSTATPDEKQRIVNEGYEANLTALFTDHATAIKEAYGRAESDSVKNKYTWLASYHKEIASYFTTSQTCACELKS